MNFKDFILESRQHDVEKLDHLDHNEDHIFNAGYDGFKHAYKNLIDVHNALSGEQNPNLKISLKHDGSPSLIFGKNPDNNKFFVASKSMFNKNPKINYSHEDIEANHGHSLGLVDTLKTAFDHLQKIMPEEGGIFQGDVLHTDKTKKNNPMSVQFTPNTVTYTYPHDSEHGKRTNRAKIGIAVHTAYSGDKLAGMKPEFGAKPGFGYSSDVHTIDSDVNLPKNYDASDFRHKIQNAEKAFTQLPISAFEVGKEHSLPIKMYINHTVRNSLAPSFNGFVDFLNSKKDSEIGKLSSPGAIKSKEKDFDAKLGKLYPHAETLDKLFDLHHHLQAAKNSLIKSLDKEHLGNFSINGEPSGPEGYVVISGNRPTKFVNRSIFSKANFDKKRGA